MSGEALLHTLHPSRLQILQGLRLHRCVVVPSHRMPSSTTDTMYREILGCATACNNTPFSWLLKAPALAGADWFIAAHYNAVVEVTESAEGCVPDASLLPQSALPFFLLGWERGSSGKPAFSSPSTLPSPSKPPEKLQDLQ